MMFPCDSTRDRRLRQPIVRPQTRALGCAMQILGLARQIVGETGASLRYARRLAAMVVMVTTAGAGAVAAGQTGDYLIGPEDSVRISVFDQPGLSGIFVVDGAGMFAFPLVGRVKAAGLTLQGLQLEMVRLLADGFLRQPGVIVELEQYRSQRVFVVGQVRQPGTYPLTSDMTIIEVLARAGSTNAEASEEALIVRPRHAGPVAGPTIPEADGQNQDAEVIRVNITKLQSGELSQNVMLQDGDTIFVPRAPTAFVFGEVRSPGSYSITTSTTVLQALSLAGGSTPLAALNRIRIIRVVDGEPQEINVGLEVLIQAGDTIIIPERFF